MGPCLSKSKVVCALTQASCMSVLIVRRSKRMGFFFHVLFHNLQDVSWFWSSSTTCPVCELYCLIRCQTVATGEITAFYTILLRHAQELEEHLFYLSYKLLLRC